MATMTSMNTPSRSPLGKVYYGIKDRCTNPNNESHYRYGGRGIKCHFKSWKHFQKWALKNGWKKGMQIHRKDPVGPYHPDNCQILTREEHDNATWGPDHRLRRKVRSVWYGLIRSGVCAEWDDFKIFYQWVILNSWQRGKDIRRHDTKLPHSPTNSFVTAPPVGRGPYIKRTPEEWVRIREERVLAGKGPKKYIKKGNPGWVKPKSTYIKRTLEEWARIRKEREHNKQAKKQAHIP